MNTYETTIEYKDREIDVIVEYDYFPAERMTHDYPGCDEDIEITNVEFDGNFTNEERNLIEENINEEQLRDEIFDYIHSESEERWDY